MQTLLAKCEWVLSRAGAQPEAIASYKSISTRLTPIGGRIGRDAQWVFLTHPFLLQFFKMPPIYLFIHKVLAYVIYLCIFIYLVYIYRLY